MFSSEYGQELVSLKTLFSHTAGSSSVGIQPAAFRNIVSSLGKGRSCQYFLMKLQWKTQTCGALFLKGQGGK